MFRTMWMRRILPASIIGLVVMLLSGCSLLGAAADSFDQAWNGMSATMTTYTQGGDLIDKVHGVSFRMTRDETFDTTDSNGTSKNDSSVLLISIGNSHISHVGSSLIMAEDGLTDLSSQPGTPTQVSLNNTQPGTPWLNDLVQRYRNLFQGKGRTVLIRSQDGTPIAVYAGNAVETFATDVPKSTWLRVDGRNLLIYRCDYTIYDTDLLVKTPA